MLPSKNNTVSIQRLTTSGKKRSMVTIETAVGVYINQIQEDLVNGLDNDGSFFSFRMFTDWQHNEILIGDKVTDSCGTIYEVRGKSISRDMTGTHHQYLIIQAYE